MNTTHRYILYVTAYPLVQKRFEKYTNERSYHFKQTTKQNPYQVF